MFCQKYMAAEITKLQHYSEGRVKDSLVEVFHKMDLMLADRQYSEVRHAQQPVAAQLFPHQSRLAAFSWIAAQQPCRQGAWQQACRARLHCNKPKS